MVVQLRADNMSVPPGVFKQGPDPNEPLPQLSLQQIRPEAKGGVISETASAAPFLRMPQPVSKHGLALLVLDHAHTGTVNSGGACQISRAM